MDRRTLVLSLRRTIPVWLSAIALVLMASSCSTEKIETFSSDTVAGIGELGSAGVSSVKGMMMSPNLKIYEIGNLEIDIEIPSIVKITDVEMYLDDFYVGNIKEKHFFITLKRGMHDISFHAPSCELFQTKIMLLGNPNKQYLVVKLKPVKADG